MSRKHPDEAPSSVRGEGTAAKTQPHRASVVEVLGLSHRRLRETSSAILRHRRDPYLLILPSAKKSHIFFVGSLRRDGLVPGRSLADVRF